MLEENEELARLLNHELSKSGLDVQTHFWDANPDRMTWASAARELTSVHAWVIVGHDFSSKILRRSLALCALSVLADRGSTFPILISAEGSDPDVSTLPTPFHEAVCVKNSLGAKCDVLTDTYQQIRPAYRLKPHGLGKLGLWFEMGPIDAFWQGAFFASGILGDTNGIPLAHEAGIAGTLPEHSTLQDPVEGMKRTVHGIPCTGFGIHNTLNSSTSYYVKVSACPDVLSFGAFPETDEATLYTIDLV